MIGTFRHLAEGDLRDLLALYRFLHPDDVELQVEGTVLNIWHKIIDDPCQMYWGAFSSGQLIGACNGAIIPNLTRGARPYALIENVVTHPDFRRKGIGRTLLGELIRECKVHNCYKIMLMSNNLRTGAHAFYRSVGFDQTAKMAFVLQLS